MGNKTANVLVGKVVGGSSAINGQFFDRPSRADFDAWKQLSSSEPTSSNKEVWDWEAILPFFKKVINSRKHDCTILEVLTC